MSLSVPSPTAHPWVLDARRNPPAYTRLVVGSELLADRASTFADELGDVCMGANFTSSINKGEIQQKARRALAKLRFYCPIIAAYVEDAGAFTRQWVYVPMQDGSDCESWLDATFAIVDRGSSLNAQEFVDKMVQSHLPGNSSGRQSVFQCYLLTDNTGAYGLYFHGSHSILDGWPTFFALALMFEWMVADRLDPVGHEFGAEYKNLPLDPVSVSGGPREVWATSGVELFAESVQHRTKATPMLVLLPPSRNVCTNGPRVRVERVFPPPVTANIVAFSKRNGLSPTHLLEAAHCLALATSNPELVSFSPEIDFSAESTIASLEKEFVGHVNKKTHLVSAFSFMPVRIAMRNILDVESSRERLLLTASALKAEYARYQANPCLPHLLVAQLAVPPPAATADLGEDLTPEITPTMLTNLGRVDARLPNEYLDRNGECALRIFDMRFGHRITTPHVVLHSWTFQDGLHIQLQASDIWASDIAYLEGFLDTMQTLILEQLV